MIVQKEDNQQKREASLASEQKRPEKEKNRKGPRLQRIIRRMEKLSSQREMPRKVDVQEK